MNRDATSRLACEHADLAYGLLGKPFNPADIPRSVEVVDSILHGAELPAAPLSLQLFH